MEIPDSIRKLAANYGPIFADVRQFGHFSEVVTEMNISDKISVAHLNSLISNHMN